jgi:hypothetical protein
MCKILLLTLLNYNVARKMRAGTCERYAVMELPSRKVLDCDEGAVEAE